MSKIRVPVAGTVGKSVRVEQDATKGAQLGVNMYDENGNVLTSASLAALLATPINTIIEDDEDVNEGVIFETDVVPGSLLARVADDELITGFYKFQNANGIRILDSGGTDYANLSHDDTDFAFTLYQTTDLNFTGISGEYSFDNSVSVSSAAGQGILTITGYQKATLALIADTSNVNETWNPFITFSQDGALVLANIGLADVGKDGHNNAVTGTIANDFVIHNRFADGGVTLAQEGVAILRIADDQNVDILTGATLRVADNLTIGGIDLAAITPGAAGSTLVGASAISGATHTTLQDSLDHVSGAGVITGGTITTSGTANAVDIAAGTGWIKATDSDNTELLHFDWIASAAINVPDGATRWFGVEYNAGAPQIVTKTSDTWDYDTEFPLGIASNAGGTRHITNIPWQTGDPVGNLIEHIDARGLRYRDERIGGLSLGESGTLNITTSVGQIMARVSEFPIPALDTSVTGDFTTVYSDGVGGHTETVVTAYPNTQYDDGSGTLVTMTNNRYANLWFAYGVDGDLYCVYGTAEYTSVAGATQESVPTDLPPRFDHHTLWIGRLMFQKSGGTAIQIDTFFDTQFNTATVSDHGALTGLTDDDHTQYLLVDGTRAVTGTLKIEDAGQTDYVEMSHDGTDFNIACTNTTDINFTGAIYKFNTAAGWGLSINDTQVDVRAGRALLVRNSGNGDYVSFSHDGTDFNIEGTNTTDLNFTSGFTWVNFSNTAHNIVNLERVNMLTDGGYIAMSPTGARWSCRRTSIADDATATFALSNTTYNMVMVLDNRNPGDYCILALAGTIAPVVMGAGIKVSTGATNPDVDTNVNLWPDASGSLSIKNRLGSTRTFTVYCWGG